MQSHNSETPEPGNRRAAPPQHIAERLSLSGRIIKAFS